MVSEIDFGNFFINNIFQNFSSKKKKNSIFFFFQNFFLKSCQSQFLRHLTQYFKNLLIFRPSWTKNMTISMYGDADAEWPIFSGFKKSQKSLQK